MQTNMKQPPLVQIYDRFVNREYIKRYQGFIFSHDEVVRADRLESELILNIHSDRTPDKIILNGKDITPTSIKQNI